MMKRICDKCNADLTNTPYCAVRVYSAKQEAAYDLCLDCKKLLTKFIKSKPPQ